MTKDNKKIQSNEEIAEAAKKLEHMAEVAMQKKEDFEHIESLQKSIKSMKDSVQQIKGRDSYTYPEKNCGCGNKKSCISSQCCEIEFIFKRVRVTAGQKLVDAALDGETTLGLAGARSGMECQFYAAVDGIGIIVPNQIWGFIQLTKRLNRTGIWHEVDRVINRVYIPCSGEKSFNYVLQAVEREIGALEKVALGKDEFGLVSGKIAVNCCNQTSQIIVPISLDGGGIGRGELEVVFETRIV